MLTITKIFERDMGHRLVNHEGKCRNLHGHRYKAEISFSGTIASASWASDEGMIIDFGDIKKIVWGFIDKELDHGYMHQKWDPIGQLAQSQWLKICEVDFAPTVEEMAVRLFNQIDRIIKNSYGNNPDKSRTGLKLHSIKLYETPNCFGYYEG